MVGKGLTQLGDKDMNNQMKMRLTGIAFNDALIQQELTGSVSLQMLKNSIKEYKAEFKAEYESAMFRVCTLFPITVDIA
jgi:hypothetical protein